VRKVMSRIGLPLTLVLIGYGPLIWANPDADSPGYVRLVLLFAMGLLATRLGITLEMNRTAAQLAGLFCVASPLAAYFVVSGAPVVPLAWGTAVLAAWIWLPGRWRRRKIALPLAGAALLLGSILVAYLADPAVSGTWHWTRVPLDFMVYGAWLVMPAPLAPPSGTVPVGEVLLGLGVWGFWGLLAAHRAMMGNTLPRNMLLGTAICVLPVLGRSSAPGLMPLPLVFFSLFLMEFLRPSKLVDSPRILLMAAFFLVLLARSTAAILAV